MSGSESDSQSGSDNRKNKENSQRHNGLAERARKRPSRYSAHEMGRQAKSIGSLGIIPIILGVGPIIGALIGQWLDERFETDPWFTIIFVIFGFVAAIREMFRLIRRAEADDKKNS